jgi:hypothetical protein
MACSTVTCSDGTTLDRVWCAVMGIKFEAVTQGKGPEGSKGTQEEAAHPLHRGTVDEGTKGN